MVDTTQRKHKWALDIFEGFCAYQKCNPWPVQDFVRFLVFNGTYKLGTVKDVLVPSLQRIQLERYGGYPENLTAALRNVYGELKRSVYATLRGRIERGKDPAYKFHLHELM